MVDLDTHTPEFRITICGTDVTSDVKSWTLTEKDNDVSTLEVTLANTEMSYSGACRVGHDISVVFGTRNDMSNKVTMMVKGVTEFYMSDRGMTVSVVGADCTEGLNEQILIGMSRAGNDLKTQIEENIKKARPNADVHVELESPEMPKYFKWPHPAMTVAQTIDFLAHMAHVKDGQASNSVEQEPHSPPAKDGTPDITGGIWVPVTSSREVSRLKDNRLLQELPNGVTVMVSPDPVSDPNVYIVDKRSGDSAPMRGDAYSAAINHLDENRCAEIAAKQKEEVIVADLTLPWYPSLRAKRGITVDNLGSEFSGHWYVQKVVMNYSVDHPALTHAHLMRTDPANDQGRDNRDTRLERVRNTHGEK